ncbi:MAG: hypothetical protein Q8S31_00850 [Alphaproteobacteria bacterium]|nr:hypothetical protein [Alphaproteobacteria bacterium]
MKKRLLLLSLLVIIASAETYAKGNKEEKCQELLLRVNETYEIFTSLLAQGRIQEASPFELLHRKLKKEYKRDCESKKKK